MEIKYIATIGLEIHAHLMTRSKMFCGCPNHFGDPPNTNVCPVCLGLPGILPVPNQEAIEKAILAGLAFNCTIPSFTKWDRKHYFYPDLPKGFQISQYDLPLCTNGWLEITQEDNSIKKIGISRAHLEEDAGKLIHDPAGYSLVDLNRAGTPLLEIVSQPELTSSKEAVLYAKQVKNILFWIGVNSGNLQEGALRFDVNISLRPHDQQTYGTKVEIKNLNSFRALEKALEYEIDRQNMMLEDKQQIVQETRLWDSEKEISRSLRSKESAHDYRYFPEPDIPPFTPTQELVDTLRQQLPLLPPEVRKLLKEQYHLPDLETHILTSNKTMYQIFSESLQILKIHPALKNLTEQQQAKKITNWLSGNFLYLLRTNNLEPEESKINATIIVDLLELVEEKTINSSVAKEIFDKIFFSGESPKQLVTQKGLSQISNTDELTTILKTILSENLGVVESIRKGKITAIGFLVGQVMKTTKGKANPEIVTTLIKKELNLT